MQISTKGALANNIVHRAMPSNLNLPAAPKRAEA